MTKTYRAAEVTRMVLFIQLVVVYLVLISVVSVKGECDFHFVNEKFEGTKEVIRIRKSKNDRQCNCKKKKDK